ncbi:MAG: alkaline phosphatase family protein [Prevotellaceae bacterium]|jgi:hypothetical protein|nr:alkaline phosphatase family protein [Prevotellaceae bacterium]
MDSEKVVTKRSIKLLLLFLCLHGGFLFAQKRLPGSKPKLIVQVVVGQMRSDYLLRFERNLSSEGFRILLDEGAFCQNARYSYMLTQTVPGLATIATGAQPAQHGLPSGCWYDRAQGDMQEACGDPQQALLESSNEQLKKSPRHLIASTFSDELKLISQRSKVLGVALEPEEAILPAGHGSDAAYWFDDMSGRFVSSAYYMEQLPEWLREFNAKQFTETYLHRSWETLLPAAKYTCCDTARQSSVAADMPLTLMPAELPKKSGRPNYGRLRETPYGDNLVKDLAISAIVSEGLGEDEETDMVAIYFGAMRNVGNAHGALSVELEDAFYRTDENIRHLIEFLNRHVGKENLLLVLTSDHGVNLPQQQLDKAKVPHGTFDYNKALVLLRSYLDIVYGKGSWVKSFTQKQIFLNHTLIEDASLRLRDVQDCAAGLMLQFSGVAHVATSHALGEATFADGAMRAMQNSFFPKRSGDIMLNLEPGWTEEADNLLPAGSAYTYDARVPLAFYGWRIKRKTIASPVDMADVAPTLSTLLGIPMPNAASGKAIAEIVE